MDGQDELEHYPNTARFLLGRLRHDLSLEERAKLESLIDTTRYAQDGERIVAKGDRCDHSTILIEGFMVRTIEQNGKRYGVSFHVPGDFVDLHCFALKRLDHNLDCIGPARLGTAPHSAIFELMQSHPHLARLLWFQTLLDAAMHREWIRKLQQLTAPRRIAHIFAEIWRRLEMVGLSFPDGFKTPLTQANIADMCGATPIHTNRALSDLRNQGIADFRRGEVRVRDRKKLETYAEFDPAYLYSDSALSLRAGG